MAEYLPRAGGGDDQQGPVVLRRGAGRPGHLPALRARNVPLHGHGLARGAATPTLRARHGAWGGGLLPLPRGRRHAARGCGLQHGPRRGGRGPLPRVRRAGGPPGRRLAPGGRLRGGAAALPPPARGWAWAAGLRGPVSPAAAATGAGAHAAGDLLAAARARRGRGRGWHRRRGQGHGWALGPAAAAGRALGSGGWQCGSR
mmetsp:Transcript_111729/g.348205  ORF Transcript_111729/g.348205 Transcript_111729/m.348205 type:complete len:201 (-) Transcript_111729:175-777(-)